MKIGYLINSGVDLHRENSPLIRVKYIVNGLRNAGHKVSFVTLDVRQVILSEQGEKTQLAKLGVSGNRGWNLFESAVRRTQGTLHLPYLGLFDSYRFFEACRKALCDYDILHERYSPLNWGGSLASRHLGLPWVMDFEADYLTEQAYMGGGFQGIQKQYAETIIRKNIQAAAAITVVSQVLKQEIIHKWGVAPEKIFILPNGVDTDLFKPNPNIYQRQRFQLGVKDDAIITFVGYFFPWHGVDHLIEAFRIAIKEFPKLKLLLIGDGILMPTVKEMIRDYQLSDSVILLGAVDHRKVPEYLNLSDICVAPYPKLNSELWFSPMKIYEYMSEGKTIIASRAGQIADVIRHDWNGYLVDPGNIQQLASAIVDLAMDKDKRIKLGKNARNDAEMKYSWTAYIKNLEMVYLSVLSKKQSK